MSFIVKIRKFIIFSLIFTSFLSCNKIKKDPETDRKELLLRKNALQIYEYAKQVKQNRQKALDDYLASFTLEQKISQMFIENLPGNKNYSPVETYMDGQPLIPGGYLFFGYNLADDEKSIIEFTDSINQFCSEYNCPQPFLAIDHEGGPVNRLKTINAPLPSTEEIAKKYSKEQAQKIYEYQALQLQNLGFHMNLAPVVEICSDDNKDFLDGRSFGDEQQVLDFSESCIRSYEDNNIATVIKHFPGNTNTDPHLGLPVIKLSKEEIFDSIKPFKQIIEDEKPSAVLMSHAIVDSVDKGVPSCLSKIWVTDILRNEYGFDGIIFSDDIFMGALAKNGYDVKTAVVMAINAGIDCIMISGRNILLPVIVLEKEAQKDKEFENKINSSFKRIIDFKIKAGLLCYEMNKDGSYKIVTARNSKSTSQMAFDFNEAKSQNIIFYKNN